MRTRRAVSWFLVGTLAGAGVAYLLHPRSGGRRRLAVADRIRGAIARTDPPRPATPHADGADVQETLMVHAPLEVVHALWSRFENFPRFMEHVLEVQSEGEHLSHWRVAGPGGRDGRDSVPIEWVAETVERSPQRIAWRSLPGSVIDHAGEVRFEPVGAHATRVTVHMTYRPPRGAVGHAVESFLDARPTTWIEGDLLRMKSMLEQRRSRDHHA